MPLRLLFLLTAFAFAGPKPEPEGLRFVLLGDRTGGAQPGIYAKVWKAAAGENPSFVISAGDSIEGLNDQAAEAEWKQWESLVAPWRRIPILLTPGNHDVWSEASEQIYVRHSRHPLHYSFDFGIAHVTVLDNSRSDDVSAAELLFLEDDLRAHATQPVKFIVSHRPGWIFNVLLHNTDFPIHRLARKYGVRCVIAGHVHQMLHYSLEGVDYVSLPSAGGHLRGSGRYEDGWFFGYTVADLRRSGPNFLVDLQVHPLGGPVTDLSRWGPAGLVSLAK